MKIYMMIVDLLLSYGTDINSNFDKEKGYTVIMKLLSCEISSDEKFDLSYYSKKPAIINEIMQKNQCSAAEKLCRRFCFRENVNCLETTELIGFIFEDLWEMGVLLTEQQSEKLLKLLTNVHNHCRKWCMCGWSPSDLASKSRPQINTISFGSGLKKAFEDGSIDKNELINYLIKQGFRINESGE